MITHLSLRNKFKRGLAAAGIATASAMVLAACAPAAQSPDATPTSEPRTGVISVVASTNIWGSIVELIGGDITGEFGGPLVEVVSIVTDPGQDPHSYEASARDQLAVSEAELIVANGGGYDPFMDQLVAARENPDYIFLRAAEGEHLHGDEDENHDGDDHQGEEDHTDLADHSEEDGHSEDGEHGHEDNEHIWFDLEEVREFAAELAATLIELRPDAFEQVNANYDFFMSELDNIEVRLEALRERALGLQVIETAPLASLLLEAAGFELVTPADLLEAVEEEREIPATALAEVLAMLASGDIALLVTNLQLLDSQAAQIQRAAEAAGVPVVALSELIVNANDDYLDFMHSAIDQLQEAIY
jgi:zinc/manganese transport system substrate-binding protein